MGICFEHVTFSYAENAKPLLHDLSCAFSKEKITVLTGASGCGKSTLLYLAAGIYPRAAGVETGGIQVEERSPGALEPAERCRLVGMMFQNPELQFCMDTVEHELIFCLENVGTDPGEIPALVTETLDFCGVRQLRTRTLLSLSGGERQKVMLACVCALKPQWLLLDEPFANVDGVSAREIVCGLKKLHETFHVGILAVDHRLDHWLDAADELWLMKDSCLQRAALPATEEASRILEAGGVIVPGRPYREKKEDRLPGAPTLILKDISVMRGERRVLHHLSAVFDTGRIHAIVGENGCGKSTLFGALSGLFPYGGEITANGAPLRRRHIQAAKIGLVTQNPQDQFIEETVYREIFAGFHRTAPAQGSGRAEEILRGIHLWRYRDLSPYMLSQGQQRKLGVAALLSCDCRILICDEPTYAQDRRSTIAIMESLQKEVRDKNLCLIFSTHDLRLAQDYADVIWRLEGGALYAQTESGL